MVKPNKKGFTLAELLIVVAVIAVLVAVAVPTFGNQLEKSRQGVDVSNLRGAYAAARIAELNSGVDNDAGQVVKFSSIAESTDAAKTNMVFLKTDEDGGTAKGSGNYTCLAYWYDPDSGALIAAVPNATGVTTPDKSLATGAISTISGRGKAQSSKVLADVSGLPGAGQKTVCYQAAQLAVSTLPTTTHTGTVDRAIRVVFVQGANGSYKLHEIAFAEKATEKLVNEPELNDILTEINVPAGGKIMKFELLTGSTPDKAPFAKGTAAPNLTGVIFKVTVANAYPKTDTEHYKETVQLVTFNTTNFEIDDTATGWPTDESGWTTAVTNGVDVVVKLKSGQTVNTDTPDTSLSTGVTVHVDIVE